MANTVHKGRYLASRKRTGRDLLRLTKRGDEAVQKGRHPAPDAGSPIVDIDGRSRIGVRDDEIDKISAIPRPFWTAS